MSIRAIAYSYGDLENLQAHKEEALVRFWDELNALAEHRAKGYDKLKCHNCGAPLHVVRAFHDGVQYVDKCKSCQTLNVFHFEDVFWLDEFELNEYMKDMLLRVIWKKMVIVVATKLPEVCCGCQRKINWTLLYEETRFYGAKCPCGKGFSTYSY